MPRMKDEGFPIDDGTPAMDMAVEAYANMQDPNLSREEQQRARDTYMDLTCTFEEEYVVDPNTGETYLSRSSSGLVYDGPDDLIGHYDF